MLIEMIKKLETCMKSSAICSSSASLSEISARQVLECTALGLTEQIKQRSDISKQACEMRDRVLSRWKRRPQLLVQNLNLQPHSLGDLNQLNRTLTAMILKLDFNQPYHCSTPRFHLLQTKRYSYISAETLPQAQFIKRLALKHSGRIEPLKLNSPREATLPAINRHICQYAEQQVSLVSWGHLNLYQSIGNH